MSDSLIVPVSQGPVEGTIRPPGSKSITNRAFILAALADGETELVGALESEDTRVMATALRQLGFEVTVDVPSSRATIVGQGGQIPEASARLFVENSGTSIRFLTALCALGEGPFSLDGITRMRERPIGDLVDALNALGADARCEMNAGYPPLAVRGSKSLGGKTSVAGNLSSQYLSGLLMMAPACATEVRIEVLGELVSKPYVEMTLTMMQQFGVHAETDELTSFRIPCQTYTARRYQIEPDASAASYFFGAAAVTGGRVTVEGLTRSAMQGDVGFVDALELMGCTVEEGENSLTLVGAHSLKGIEIDMNAISDTAQTLAAVAIFADSPTTIRNVEHMRHKETDRVEAVSTELNRLGIRTDVFADGLRIYPGPIRPGEVQTYNDHRMAMSFALIGLREQGIQIANPGCTAKTYPHFFEDLAGLCDSGR